MTKSNSMSSDLNVVSLQTVDRWWGEPIPNRLTAAYHIGRLLNQLGWHFQHSLVYVGQGEMVERVLGQIEKATYTLVINPPNQLAETVNAVQREWEKLRVSESVADDLHEIIHRSEETHEATTEDLEALVASYVSPIYDELIAGIAQELSDYEGWALELGRCLDQGVRRPDVVRFFEGEVEIEEPAIKTHQDSSNYTGIEVKPLWRVRQPGELEPDMNSWPHRLQELLVKVGIPVTNVVSSLEASGKTDLRKRLDVLAHVVDSLDVHIRKHLTIEGSKESTEYLSRFMTKKEAARYHHGSVPTNPTVYLERLVKQEIIREPIGSGQRWRFDVRDFPENVRAEML